MSTIPLTIIDVARLFRFVRERTDKPNSGQRVNSIQTWSGGVDGESWCCYFVTMVLDLVYQGKSLVPRCGACQTVYDLAKKNGWLVTTPLPGDLFLYVNEVDHAHHIGIVTQSTPLVGIAGNGSPDGLSSNGDGVYEHALTTKPPHIKFVRVPAPPLS